MSVRRPAALLIALGVAAAHAQEQPPSAAHPPPIDQLFSALKAAPTEEAAGTVEARILDAWVQQATPAVRLLLARGYRNLGQHAASDAFDSYDGAIALQPDVAEAWHGRAMARFGLGDSEGALRDIQQSLQREPRNFAALADLSRIAEAQGNAKGALSAWEKVLELAPHTPGGEDRLQELRRKAEGQGI